MANFNIQKGKIYIQYRLLDKRKSLKTNLEATEENLLKAEALKKKIEEKVEIKIGDMKYRNILSSFENTKDITVEKAIEIYKIKLALTSKGYQTRFDIAMNNFYKIVPRNMKASKVTYEHSLRFVKLLTDQSLSNASVRSYFDHVKVLFLFLVKNKHLNNSPLSAEVLPRKTKKAIVVFDNNMLSEILLAAQKSDLMFFNILSLLLLTGLRPIDLLRLKTGDINFADRRIHIRISKTNKEIYIPLSQTLYAFIIKNMSYIIEQDQEQLVFPGYSVARLGCRFRRLKKRLGIKEKYVFNLKTFRRNFATHYAKSLNIQDVAYLLGHDEVETTKSFYANTIVDNVRNKMDKFDENQDIVKY